MVHEYSKVRVESVKPLKCTGVTLEPVGTVPVAHNNTGFYTEDNIYTTDHGRGAMHNAKEKVKDAAHDVKEACGHAADAVKDKLHDAKVAVAGH
ncbi:unnamed protein product [Caenorhabditis auriculariae]|uniref:Uncharacterized protein n=1 Tax=Caenorhabditis auriculariae TaxID=2777116 RepID=A0A8S1HW68_9PELO|nr:unnamed protein product [Caenorhabditis auriculariae]